jgi:transposase
MRMRGDDEQSGHLFSYLSPEQRVPADHPLRAIRTMTDEALGRLSPRFEAMYAKTGRPSIPPEHLLRALLLQVLYSVRSERMLIEQLEYNLLFRWFVGLGMDDAVWAPTTFTKNRDRLLDGDIARAFFEDVVAQARGRRSWPRSISRSTARCWKRGPARRVSSGRISPATRPTIPGIPPSISTANGARIRRINRRPIPRAGCSRRPRVTKRSWRISAKC